MATITLGKLHTEGRLSLGDRLHHNEKGWFVLVAVGEDGTLFVRHETTNASEKWAVDFGEGARIVPASPQAAKYMRA